MWVVQILHNQETKREWCINGERPICMSKQNKKKISQYKGQDILYCFWLTVYFTK